MRNQLSGPGGAASDMVELAEPGASTALGDTPGQIKVDKQE